MTTHSSPGLLQAKQILALEIDKLYHKVEGLLAKEINLTRELANTKQELHKLYRNAHARSTRS